VELLHERCPRLTFNRSEVSTDLRPIDRRSGQESSTSLIERSRLCSATSKSQRPITVHWKRGFLSLSILRVCVANESVSGVTRSRSFNCCSACTVGTLSHPLIALRTQNKTTKTIKTLENPILCKEGQTMVKLS